MSEDESFKKDGSYKKFLARVRAILWVWFVSTPFIIGTYLGDFARPVSLSLFAFAVITTWIVLHRIMTDDKENLSKNIDILRGNEGTKETSDEEAESAVDLEKGLPLEVDWISGAVTRLAKAKGIEAPTNETIHGLLSPYKDGL